MKDQAPAPLDPLTSHVLRERALAMLGRREHTQQELRQALHNQGGDSAEIEALLLELSDCHLQSDSRFAEVFTRSRAERGHGPRVIEAELQQRGVASELIGKVMADSGYDWAACARDVRQKRFGSALPASSHERARQLRFLQYRGFTSSQSLAAIKDEND